MCFCVNLFCTTVLQFEGQCLLFCRLVRFTSPGPWTRVKFQDIFVAMVTMKVYELPCSVIVAMNCLLYTADRVRFGFTS